MDLDDLRTKIMNDITEAKMPIDMVYYLMKDMTAEITVVYNQYLTNKYKKQKEQATETTESDNK